MIEWYMKNTNIEVLVIALLIFIVLIVYEYRKYLKSRNKTKDEENNLKLFEDRYKSYIKESREYGSKGYRSYHSIDVVNTYCLYNGKVYKLIDSNCEIVLRRNRVLMKDNRLRLLDNGFYIDYKVNDDIRNRDIYMELEKKNNNISTFVAVRVKESLYVIDGVLYSPFYVSLDDVFLISKENKIKDYLFFDDKDICCHRNLIDINGKLKQQFMIGLYDKNKYIDFNSKYKELTKNG